MSNIEFYQSFGINLSDNGINSYAFNKTYSLELLKILKTNNIEIFGVDILYKYDDGYNYLTEPSYYVSWNLEDIEQSERYIFLENKIKNYNVVNDIENIAFQFVDSLTYGVWNTINERTRIIIDLIQFNKPINKINQEVKSLTWDWEGKPLYIIKKTEILIILDKFIKSEISSSEVEEWANLVECREDLDVEDDYIYEIVFILSNPVLHGQLNKEICEEIIRKLKSK